jgi:uncharacterized protein YhbP (UPF0306 family)
MNNIPDSRIVKFINSHHVLTLATSNSNVPYSANCFYVYHESENALIFTSDMETKHAQDVVKQELVAGSIVLETNIVGKIQGVQFQGQMMQPDKELHKKAKKEYLKRFPIAMLMKTNIWIVKLSYLKFTDNRLGFGKKLIWGEVK